MAEFHPIHWFNKADADLRAAHRLYGYEEDQYPLICFLSHQTVEKLLKAYLYWKGEKDVIFSHNLVELNAICESYDKTFEGIASICKSLNGYYVDTRYPSELAFDDYTVRLALADAEKILSFGPIATAFAEAKADYEKKLHCN